MTINHQFSDVDVRGALIRAQAAALDAEHQASVGDVLATGDFRGGQRWAATSSRYMRTDKSANSQEQHGQNRRRRRL
jgi:hypothetical protein